jgi:hypothetical protein
MAGSSLVLRGALPLSVICCGSAGCVGGRWVIAGRGAIRRTSLYAQSEIGGNCDESMLVAAAGGYR